MSLRNKNKFRMSSGLASVLLCNLAMSSGGFAQDVKTDDESTQLEEIIVTAQFRNQSIKDVPIAMSAYDAEFMREADMEDVWDVMQLTPGFAGVGTGGSWLNTISVRGIRTNDFGVGGDTSVGLFKDGVYQGRTGGAVTNFFDMERSEALRGPQGFLYGRNTISGAINTFTNKPNADGVEAFGQMTVGQSNLIEVEGMVNIPLGDGWAARAAVYSVTEDGHLTNVADPDGRKLGQYKSNSGRFSLGYEGDTAKATLIAEYEERRGDGVVYRSTDQFDQLTDLGFSETDKITEVNTDFPGHDKAEIFTLTGLIEWDLDGVIVSSVTGFRDHDWDYSEDDDGRDVPFYHWVQHQTVKNYSQDFRIASDNDGPFTWLVGVSGYVEKLEAGMGSVAGEDEVCSVYFGADCQTIWGGTFNYNEEGLVEVVDIEGTYKGYGVSANATYAVSDKFEIDAGLRYSYDEKDFGIGAPAIESDIGPWLGLGYWTHDLVKDKSSWDSFTPRVALRYAVSEDVTVWASVTRGFKAGGYSSFGMRLPEPEEIGLPPCAWGIYCVLNADGSVPEGTSPQQFDPESVWSYEAGIKGDIDDKVQFDLNAFAYSYKDMQIRYWDTDLFNIVVENVGRVKGYGLEGSVKAQATDNLSIQLGASAMHSKVNDIPLSICDCEDNRLSQQPKFILTGLMVYSQPLENGSLSASADFRYQSQFFGALENEDYNSYPGRLMASARVGYYSNEGWGISAYVDNLTDAKFFGGGTGAGAGSPFPQLQFDVSRPRSFGLTLNYRFGD